MKPLEPTRKCNLHGKACKRAFKIEHKWAGHHHQRIFIKLGRIAVCGGVAVFRNTVHGLPIFKGNVSTLHSTSDI